MERLASGSRFDTYGSRIVCWQFMSRKVIVQAPAKINLHLRILGKRPDGFHNLSSLFQAVSLGDTLVVQTDSDEGVRLFGDFDCPSEENTIVRAAEAFRRKTGQTVGVRVWVTKRVPAGAGLGGGSSDAAAMLLALNHLYGGSLSSDELAAVGAVVGSDVPFFLKGTCAIVSGRGEIVEPIGGRTDFFVTLLFPGFTTHTAAAYAAVDAVRRSGEGMSRSLDAANREDFWIREEYEKPPRSWNFRNDFYEALVRESPELGQAYGALKRTGAEFVSLTGSGSAFFGIFRSRVAAEQAAETLNGRKGRLGLWTSDVAVPLARMPSPRLEY